MGKYGEQNFTTHKAQDSTAALRSSISDFMSQQGAIENRTMQKSRDITAEANTARAAARQAARDKILDARAEKARLFQESEAKKAEAHRIKADALALKTYEMQKNKLDFNQNQIEAEKQRQLKIAQSQTMAKKNMLGDRISFATEQKNKVTNTAAQSYATRMLEGLDPADPKYGKLKDVAEGKVAFSTLDGTGDYKDIYGSLQTTLNSDANYNKYMTKNFGEGSMYSQLDALAKTDVVLDAKEYARRVMEIAQKNGATPTEQAAILKTVQAQFAPTATTAQANMRKERYKNESKVLSDIFKAESGFKKGDVSGGTKIFKGIQTINAALKARGVDDSNILPGSGNDVWDTPIKINDKQSMTPLQLISAGVDPDVIASAISTASTGTISDTLSMGEFKTNLSKILSSSLGKQKLTPKTKLATAIKKYQTGMAALNAKYATPSTAPSVMGYTEKLRESLAANPFVGIVPVKPKPKQTVQQSSVTAPVGTVNTQYTPDKSTAEALRIAREKYDSTTHGRPTGHTPENAAALAQAEARVKLGNPVNAKIAAQVTPMDTEIAALERQYSNTRFSRSDRGKKSAIRLQIQTLKANRQALLDQLQ